MLFYFKKLFLGNNLPKSAACFLFVFIAGLSFTSTLQAGPNPGDETQRENRLFMAAYEGLASQLKKLPEVADVPSDLSSLRDTVKSMLSAHVPATGTAPSFGLFRKLDEAEAAMKNNLPALQNKSGKAGVDPDLKRSLDEFIDLTTKALLEISQQRSQALSCRINLLEWAAFGEQLGSVYEELSKINDQLARTKMREAIDRKLARLVAGNTPSDAKSLKTDTPDRRVENIPLAAAEQITPKPSQTKPTSKPAAYTPSQVDSQPVPKLQVRPTYPFELRRAGKAGEVVVDFVVAANGSVVNAHAVKSSDKGFEQSAVESVAKWKFKPARKNGQDVATQMQVPIVFTPNQD